MKGRNAIFSCGMYLSGAPHIVLMKRRVVLIANCGLNGSDLFCICVLTKSNLVFTSLCMSALGWKDFVFISTICESDAVFAVLMSSLSPTIPEKLRNKSV